MYKEDIFGFRLDVKKYMKEVRKKRFKKRMKSLPITLHDFMIATAIPTLPIIFTWCMDLDKKMNFLQQKSDREYRNRKNGYKEIEPGVFIKTPFSS